MRARLVQCGRTATKRCTAAEPEAHHVGNGSIAPAASASNHDPTCARPGHPQTRNARRRRPDRCDGPRVLRAGHSMLDLLTQVAVLDNAGVFEPPPPTYLQFREHAAPDCSRSRLDESRCRPSARSTVSPGDVRALSGQCNPTIHRSFRRRSPCLRHAEPARRESCGTGPRCARCPLTQPHVVAVIRLTQWTARCPKTYWHAVVARRLTTAAAAATRWRPLVDRGDR